MAQFIIMKAALRNRRKLQMKKSVENFRAGMQKLGSTKEAVTIDAGLKHGIPENV